MKNITGYNLACGSVQRKEFKNYWVELYKESGTFHVRTGKTGEEWSQWESFDSGYKKPLTLARDCYWSFYCGIEGLAEYAYLIDLDERGIFRAHVENLNEVDGLNFSISNDNEDDDGRLWIVEDGFMKHTDDVDGLLKYLIDLKVIPSHSTLTKGN